MWFMAGCYGASKHAQKGVDLVNLPSQQRLKVPGKSSHWVKNAGSNTWAWVTDVQSIQKFQYAIFDLMRRKLPWPEQTTNGVFDKSLMKELDWVEHDDWWLDGHGLLKYRSSEASRKTSNLWCWNILVGEINLQKNVSKVMRHIPWLCILPESMQ